jgi:hypothetical protein
MLARERRPPLRERSPHERRHEQRNDGGPLRRRARHGQKPAAGRWHHGGGYRPELPPRTLPARAPRSPPPTPRRSAGHLRSASAENPDRDSFTGRRSGPHAAHRQPDAVERLAAARAKSRSVVDGNRSTGGAPPAAEDTLVGTGVAAEASATRTPMHPCRRSAGLSLSSATQQSLGHG